jgi:ribose transport system substrate-binding protein
LTEKKFRSAFVVLGLVGLLALLIAGCGSSGSSSASSETSAGTESGTEATGGEEGGGSDASTVYAPGVPSMEELEEGSGEALPEPLENPPVKGASVIQVSCGEESPGCSGFAKGMVEPAEAIGWNYRIIDGRLNVGEGWAKGIREAIVAKPDAIVLDGVNCPEELQPLKEAKAAGIAVLGMFGLDCDSKVFGTSEEPLFIPVEYTEGEANGEEMYESWGARQADFLINKTKGEAKVILVAYKAPSGELMTKGWKRELEKCSGCEIVEEVQWEGPELYPGGPLSKNIATALVKNPEANAALGGFDSVMTVAGLSKAVVDAGRASTMVVVGGEGGAEAQALIREGKGFTGTASAHSLEKAAWVGINAINRYLAGESPTSEGLGWGLVDEENLSPPGKPYESPLDYKSAFESNWGAK